MKTWLKVFLGVVVALGAGLAQAVGSFEGEVDMKTTHGNQDGKIIQYLVKGNKIRFQGGEQNGKQTGAVIFDNQTHEMIMVMDKNKMYMVSQLHPEKFNYSAKDHHFKMTKTGNSQNILGYDCQEWDYMSDDNNGKIWFASGIGNWWGTQMAAQADKLSADQRAIIQTVVSQKLFPMKYETDDKSGHFQSGMEVVKVESKTLDSSLFGPPAGYKKFDMGNLFGGGANVSNSSSDSNQGQQKDLLSGVKPKLPF